MVWKLNNGDQLGISSPFDFKQGYGNWFWGFTNSCLISMIRTAGFSIVEKHLGKFYSFIVCKVCDEHFIPVSGEWSVPEYKEDIKNFTQKTFSN